MNDELVVKILSTSTCSICLEILCETRQFSPCGHSICGICYFAYFAYFDNIYEIKKCPECRTTIKESIRNFRLDSIIHLIFPEKEGNRRKILEESYYFNKEINLKEYLTGDLVSKIIKFDNFLTIKEECEVSYTCEEYTIKERNRYDYIEYNDIAMFDIDDKNPNVLKQFSDYSTESFVVYKSRGGFHVFLTSRRIDYQDSETLKFLCKFKNQDLKYTLISWMKKKTPVRLSKKSISSDFNNNETYAHYIDYGTNHDEKIKSQVNEHFVLTKAYHTKKYDSTKPVIYEETIVAKNHNLLPKFSLTIMGSY